jgi:hypothetical protein
MPLYLDVANMCGAFEFLPTLVGDAKYLVEKEYKV